MPIKWSAVEVSEAMDKIEVEVKAAMPYMEKARTIAREARGISNLPLYVGQKLHRLDYLISGDFGAGPHGGGGSLMTCIGSVRDSIPDGVLEAEREANKNGKTEKLM